MNIVVIGVGGIGSAVLPALLRYLSHAYEGSVVMLLDGDSYEPQNVSRYALGDGNKAVSLASYFSSEFPNLFIRGKPEFVTSMNAHVHIEEGDIVFLSVDNHLARKVVSARCAALSNVILISGGNDYSDGNVQIYIRKDGADAEGTVPLGKNHPEIESARDQAGEAGCGILVESLPQLIFTNTMIAAYMLAAFWRVVEKPEGGGPVTEVYVDLVTMRARSK